MSATSTSRTYSRPSVVAPLLLTLAVLATLSGPARALPRPSLAFPFIAGRQSGPSHSCACPHRTCPVDQTCYGTDGVGFCSTVSFGNKPLKCTSVATPAPTAGALPSPSPESLGSGILCLCPKPDCPLGELCFSLYAAGVCYRRIFAAVFKERKCVKPSPTSSPGPSALASAAPSPSAGVSPSPSATPSPSFSPSVSPSPDSALPNPNAGNQGTFTSVANSPPVASQPPICVAAAHLAHLPAHALVFPAHRSAPVLCDRAGSCATAGHMVLYNGRPMMMRTYCLAVPDAACEARTTLVNSPKFERAWRAHSHTPGLQFTAMAARWATPVEEAALTLALRLGL